MVDEKQEIKDILGFGKEMSVLVGLTKDGKQDIKKFHFTPAPLEEIPNLMTKLNVFFEGADMTKWTPENTQNGAEILLISLKRMHPELTVDEIKKTFSLGVMAKAVRIVMDVNDFLSELQEMNTAMTKANLTTQK